MASSEWAGVTCHLHDADPGVAQGSGNSRWDARQKGPHHAASRSASLASGAGYMEMTAEKVEEWRDSVDSYVADEEEVPGPSCVVTACDCARKALAPQSPARHSLTVSSAHACELHSSLVALPCCAESGNIRRARHKASCNECTCTRRSTVHCRPILLRHAFRASMALAACACRMRTPRARAPSCCWRRWCGELWGRLRVRE